MDKKNGSEISASVKVKMSPKTAHSNSESNQVACGEEIENYKVILQDLIDQYEENQETCNTKLMEFDSKNKDLRVQIINDEKTIRKLEHELTEKKKLKTEKLICVQNKSNKLVLELEQKSINIKNKRLQLKGKQPMLLKRINIEFDNAYEVKIASANMKETNMTAFNAAAYGSIDKNDHLICEEFVNLESSLEALNKSKLLINSSGAHPAEYIDSINQLLIALPVFNMKNMSDLNIAKHINDHLFCIDSINQKKLEYLIESINCVAQSINNLNEHEKLVNAKLAKLGDEKLKLAMDQMIVCD